MIEDRYALTRLEIGFNRLFAVLLILLSLPLLLNILTLPTVILFIVFGLFLCLSKKYHLFVNIIFLIFALGIYFVPIPPIAWGFFRSLKEYRLNDFVFSFPVLWLIPLSVFVSFAVRNLLGNIFIYLKNISIPRNTFYLTSLLIVFAATIGYPLLDSVKLRDRTMNVNTAVGGELPNIYTQQSLTFLDRYHMAGNFTSKFDSSSKKYIYHLQLQEPLKKGIQFTKVEADGEKINFTTNNQIKCLNCQKDVGNPYGLIFPAGKDIDFTVTSDQLIRVIKFTEPEDKEAEFIFWK
jgi:hypothetical protein